MAVVEAHELLEGRTGSTDENNVATLQRSWIVKTDSEADDVVTVTARINTVETTGYNHAHPTYPAARARTIKCDPYGSTKVWKVTWTYSSAPLKLAYGGTSSGFPEAQSTSNPSTPDQATDTQATAAPDRKPQIKFSRVENKIAIRKDINGVPLRNSAGDPFEGVEVDQPRLAIDIKYWSLNVNVPHILAYWNTINDDAWNGFPARTLLVKEFNTTPKHDIMGYSGSTPIYGLVWECDVRLEYEQEEWQLKLLDAGRRELVGGVLKAIKVAGDGRGIDEPWPLNANGTAWNGSGSPNYKFFNIYQESDFGGLLI